MGIGYCFHPKNMEKSPVSEHGSLILTGSVGGKVLTSESLMLRLFKIVGVSVLNKTRHEYEYGMC